MSIRVSKSRRFVIANWKMYLQKPDEAKRFITGLRRRSRNFKGVDAWVAPPFTLLPGVATSCKGSHIVAGAQSLSMWEGPQHTGEISATMLKSAGAAFTIVGHSERRAMGESNDSVHAQLVRAAGAGLMVVLCVGERERDQFGAHFALVAEQLMSAFKGAQSYAARIFVAYEPVWAIGKAAGDAMKPSELEEMVIFIRKTLADTLGRTEALKLPVLYGGSVEPSNALELIEQGGINGFLVGHASAELDSFVEILTAVRGSSRKS